LGGVVNKWALYGGLVVLAVALARSSSWVAFVGGLTPLVLLGSKELYERYLKAQTERAKK